MTSPYSSNLLQQPVDGTHPRPRRSIDDRVHVGEGARVTAHRTIEEEPVQSTSSVTRVVAAPQQAYAPQPYAPQPAFAPQVSYIQESQSRAGRGAAAISAVLLALVVLLVGIVALVGGYYATKAASPSGEEMALEAGIAVQQGFQAGRTQGVAEGRGDALVQSEATTSLRTSTASSTAYNAAYQRGLKAGSKYRPPVSRGYYPGGSSYRAPRFNGFGGGEVRSALGYAQNLANITGAPVDVEVY